MNKFYILIILAFLYYLFTFNNKLYPFTHPKGNSYLTNRINTVIEDVFKFANKYDVPPEIIIAIIWQESDFKPDAVGLSNERGLMQLKNIALIDSNHITKKNYSFEDLFNPTVNIEAGTGYLRWLRNRLSTWYDTVRAYNAGIGRVLERESAGINYANQVNEKVKLIQKEGIEFIV